MCLYPTSLLAGLLLAFVAFNVQNAQATNEQALPSSHSFTAAQQADSGGQPFHRGSGRFQSLQQATTAG